MPDRIKRKLEAAQILAGSAPHVDQENFRFSLPRIYYNEEHLREQHTRLFAAKEFAIDHDNVLHLAQGAFLSRDASLAKRIAELAAAWWQTNPPFHSNEWKNPIATSIRLIQWSWAFSAVREQLDAPTQQHAQEYIYRHAQYLSAKLAWLSGSAEKMIAASALATAGTHFSLFDRAEFWEKQGWKVINEQVHKAAESQKAQAIEGIDRILEYVIVAYSFAKMKRLALPVSMLMDLERTVLRLIETDAFSADDATSAIPHLPFDRAMNMKRLLANSLAIIRGNASLKALGQPLDEWTFWVFGDKAVENYEGV